MTPLGLYIHIPFCKAKCAYCDFYSLPHSEEKIDAYCAALTRHLTEVAPRTMGQTVDSIYFGGGTPSYLGAKRLAALLRLIRKKYTVARDAEISWEANPDSVGTAADIKRLHKAGFNRLSLGVQVMDDTLLRAIGRIHTVEQVHLAVQNAKKAGIDNISLDLIYGLPSQTLSHWQNTLHQALLLEPQHISCYGLKPEEGTPLWQCRETANLPDDDTQADMYLWAVEFLREQGYAQYEISNFARPGFSCRHNLKYWQLQPYAGFGPGAHSDFGDVRFAYERDLDAYTTGILCLSEQEEMAPRERCLEYIMLSLRTSRGIDSAYFERTYRLPFSPLKALLEEYCQHGLAAQCDTRWYLTPQGFLVSNAIILSLQEALGQFRAERLSHTTAGDYRVKIPDKAHTEDSH